MSIMILRLKNIIKSFSKIIAVFLKKYLRLDTGDVGFVVALPLISYYYDMLACCLLFILMAVFLILSFFYDAENDDADLKAEKDEYLIFGAIGSLGLVLLEQKSISFLQNEQILINVMAVAIYLLFLVAIHYRRLSAEIYRREEAKKQNAIIVMSRDRAYTVTSFPPENEKQ